jgi:hypothetical protein
MDQTRRRPLAHEVPLIPIKQRRCFEDLENIRLPGYEGSVRSSYHAEPG